MTNIDLTGKVKFQTQFAAVFGDKKAQNVACARACKKMLLDAGYGYVDASVRVDMLTADKSGKMIKAKTYREANILLDQMLESDKPVIVAVDRGTVVKGNANPLTDHFVVVVGRNAAGGYRFYDPGTSYPSKGASEENILSYDPTTGFLQGKSKYNGKLYTVTEVRPTK